jgi:hypothetical protein
MKDKASKGAAAPVPSQQMARRKTAAPELSYDYEEEYEDDEDEYSDDASRDDNDRIPSFLRGLKRRR